MQTAPNRVHHVQVGYRDGFRISSQGPEAPDHGGQQGGVVPKARGSA